MKRSVLIHHEDAGGGVHDRDVLTAMLADQGVSAMPCEVDGAAIRAALSDDVFELAIVAGGDGTAALTITIAAELRMRGLPVPPIAILPLGGLNNIACAFGIEGEPASIARRWQAGRLTQIDVGAARGSWGRRCFVEATGFGALSEAFENVTVSADEASAKKAIGRAAFREVLTRVPPADVALSLDGERIICELLMLEVLNLPRIGPRLALAPDADPADGQLDVLMVGPDARDGMIDWLDRDCDPPCPVPTRRVREVVVDGGFTRCRLDDPKRERATDGAPVTLTVMTEPVILLLPSAAPPEGDCE